VHENRESTARQYDLKRRAQALGWAADQIAVIDEDLGLSGATTVPSTLNRPEVTDVFSSSTSDDSTPRKGSKDC
jgi:hypothetical protein